MSAIKQTYYYVSYKLKHGLQNIEIKLTENFDTKESAKTSLNKLKHKYPNAVVMYTCVLN